MLRLILALLLAFAPMAMPTAACAAPMAMSGHPMHGSDHPAPMPPHHDCIGCMPIADWDGMAVTSPPPIVAPAPVARIAALPLRPGPAPLPPPPRSA